MTKHNSIVGEINAWAMRDGLFLGLVGILTLTAWRMSVVQRMGDILFLLLLLSGPVASVVLTRRYRNAVVAEEGFTFTRGFMHALFTGFYASIWVSLAMFVYLQYLDHGVLFAAYAQMVYSPEGMQAAGQIDPRWTAMIDSLSGGRGAAGLSEALRGVGAATYSVMPIYGALVVGPVVSVVAGWLCQRKLY